MTDDLAGVERGVRDLAEFLRDDPEGAALSMLLAEYDRRGDALEQAEHFGIGEWRVTQWAYDQAVRVMNEAKAAAIEARASIDS